MASIRNVMEDVGAILAAQTVVNKDNTETTPYVRVWNNQLKYDENGKMEVFPKPAYFIEIVTPLRYEVIGQGYRSADVGIRIHIVDEYMNDPDNGTFAQDLDVIDLKNNVVIVLTYFNPSGCGPLTSISEDQDTDHNNLYHFIVDFECNFTDSKGSRLDDGRNYFRQTTSPTELQVNPDVAIGGGQEPSDRKQTFLIPQTR